jgi:hypothetical protein
LKDIYALEKKIQDNEGIENGLKNQQLKVMKRAVRELPESLEKEINDVILNFESEYKEN